MINKYFDGEIPAYVKDATPFDASLVDLVQCNGGESRRSNGRNGVFRCVNGYLAD